MTGQPPRRPQVFEADDPRVKPSAADADAADDGWVQDREAAARSGAREQDDAGAATPRNAAYEDVADAAGFRRAGDRETASDEGDLGPPAQTTLPPERSARFGLFGAFLSAVLALAGIAIGLWFSQFVSVAVARDDWLGWTAKGLALFIAGVIVVVLLKEGIGFLRLARLGRLRRNAEQALAAGDIRAEKRVVAGIKGLASGRPQYRWALAKFRDQERYQTAPGALLGLADSVLLADADKEARRVIYESARRVAVVTAVVPIAFISVLFVLFENVRMVRRLAAAYGGRPGLIGGSRLLFRVIFHIAATGAIALTDDLFGQFLGQDVIRRLSARLGEGAFNGALTARLGIVAIELCRPCPYIEAKPLRARHVVAELFPEFKPAELIGRAVGRRAEK